MLRIRHRAMLGDGAARILCAAAFCLMSVPTVVFADALAGHAAVSGDSSEASSTRGIPTAQSLSDHAGPIGVNAVDGSSDAVQSDTGSSSDGRSSSSQSTEDGAGAFALRENAVGHGAKLQQDVGSSPELSGVAHSGTAAAGSGTEQQLATGKLGELRGRITSNEKAARTKCEETAAAERFSQSAANLETGHANARDNADARVSSTGTSQQFFRSGLQRNRSVDAPGHSLGSGRTTALRVPHSSGLKTMVSGAGRSWYGSSLYARSSRSAADLTKAASRFRSEDFSGHTESVAGRRGSGKEAAVSGIRATVTLVRSVYGVGTAYRVIIENAGADSASAEGVAVELPRGARFQGASGVAASGALGLIGTPGQQEVQFCIERPILPGEKLETVLHVDGSRNALMSKPIVTIMGGSSGISGESGAAESSTAATATQASERMSLER